MLTASWWREGRGGVGSCVNLRWFFRWSRPGLLTDEVPQGGGVIDGLLQQQGAGGGAQRRLLEVAVLARPCVHPPGQHAAEG